MEMGPFLRSILFVSLIAVPKLVTATDEVVLGAYHPVAPHPWIRKLASVGDSYAAGLGAGKRLDFSCSRYDHAYPNLLNSSHFLGESKNRTHQYLACSGAISQEIVDKQISALDDELDVVTVSAGGNDVGLSMLMNQCIYQFFMASDSDCESALNQTWHNIDTYLTPNITNVISALKPKLNKDHGIVYYTGYARFWGVEDEICDNITWAVWSYESAAAKQFLTLERRQTMNDMVHAVNGKIKEAVEHAGPNVVFIDYDQFVTENRGRYCESGVTEPNPNRDGLYFYEWKTVDGGENSTALSMAGDDVPKGSFEGHIAEWTNKTLQEHPDWQLDPDKGKIDEDKMHPAGIFGDTVNWMLPDFWKRVFHLRPDAHKIIAGLILEDIASRTIELESERLEL